MVKNLTKIRTNFEGKNSGVGLVEMLIVIAVVAVGFMAILSFMIFSRGVTFQVARNTEAMSFAEEGVEAVRSMRDESWAGNITTLISGTTYYPTISGGKWTLATMDPGVLNNLYTRTVVIEDGYRDANDDISASGALDPDTKKVTVRVSWQERGGSKEATLTTYITNFLSN